LVAGLDATAILAGFYFAETLVDDFAEVFCLGPEIMAIHLSMSEPQGTVMGMVVLLIGGGFHRPVASHRGAAGADEGVEVGARDVLKEILGEELAIDFHAQAIGLLGDAHAGGRACGRTGNGADEQSQCDSGNYTGVADHG
jgi:hypothetical protein